MNAQDKKYNPLESETINKLLIKFGVPSVIAMLVNALYNMVDQMFIGIAVGRLGNAATTVALPITTMGIALGLLIGQGGASKQNLELGAGNKKKAEQTVGNVIGLSITVSLLLAIFAFVFMKPLLLAFGATDKVMPYAVEYTRIIIIGLPFMIGGTCLNNSIRADTSATFAMISMLSGAITNIILDAVFVFGFNMGMKGAAIATVTGQILTCIISASYIGRYKHLKITKECFRFDIKLCKIICALGLAPCINQIAMFVVQIVFNNVMKYYGARSVYGEETPISCIGIVMKVNMVFMAIVIGVAQGAQPIISYNYGAGIYKRCRKAYKQAAKINLVISAVFFTIFQLFPRQIVSMFGTGDKEYMQFGIMCFRIYLFMTFANGLQPLTAQFFTAIGKAPKGAFIALTRQILFLLPLVVILPIFFGLEGAMYAAPIADTMALILVILFVTREFNQMRKLENK